MSGIVIFDLLTFLKRDLPGQHRSAPSQLDLLLPRISCRCWWKEWQAGIGYRSQFADDIDFIACFYWWCWPASSNQVGATRFLQPGAGWRDGEHFRVHKFRSMHKDAESDGAARWASSNDSRITTLEPSFARPGWTNCRSFTMCQGDMSLVGPRPERPEFVLDLENDPYYRERHRVKPGLTGGRSCVISMVQPGGCETEAAI